MGIVIVAVDDFFDGLGKSFEDINVLRVTETPDLHCLAEKLQLFVQALGGDAIDLQGPNKEGKIFANLNNGGSGDNTQIHGGDQLLKQGVRQVFQTEAEAQSIKFRLVIRAIH